MIKYVAGFLFSQDRTKVALIRKNKPEWQAGKLNGIGGKIENGESASDAMEREFKEEAGVFIPWYGWDCFADIEGEDYKCYFFRCFSDDLFNVRTMEDEFVCIYDVNDVNSFPHIPNLSWLIPLALDGTIIHANIKDSGN